MRESLVQRTKQHTTHTNIYIYIFNLIRDRKKEIVYLDLVSFKGGERSEQTRKYAHTTTATMIARASFQAFVQE